MIVTILSTILLLSILIFAHELGHSIVAKIAGVGVKIFSLGFGPRLIGFKHGETDYRLSAIPLGGFVSMVGEQSSDEEMLPDEANRAFTNKTVSWRLAIVGAGPIANLLFSFLIYYLVILIWGIPNFTTRIGDVSKGYPAALAGVMKDDIILAINNKGVDYWTDILKSVQSCNGEPIYLKLKRQEQIIDILVTPRATVLKNIFNEKQIFYQIGIMVSDESIVKQLGPIKAIKLAFERVVIIAEIMWHVIFKLFQGKMALDNLGGIIQIGQIAGQAARLGLEAFLTRIAMLSINLAIVNLLPIPALDGGHIIFLIWEGITKKPIPVNLYRKAQQIGMAILVILMGFIMFNDISRLIYGTNQ